MRLLLAAMATFVALFQAQAGPIIVGNGGGQGEYSVVFARTKLAEILRDCGATACGLDPAEKLLFAKLEMGVSTAPQLILKTEKELGSVLFLLQGAEVWINQDLLWIDSQKSEAYDLAHGVVLWMQILEAQLTLDPAEFAGIEAKALSSLKNLVQRAYYLSIDLQMFEYLMWKRSSGTDMLLVRDPDFRELDVTSAIASALKCTKITSLRFFSPSLIPGPGGLGPKDDLYLNLDFGLKWSCDSGSGNSAGRAFITARRSKEGGPLVFDSSSLFVHVETGGMQ